MSGNPIIVDGAQWLYKKPSVPMDVVLKASRGNDTALLQTPHTYLIPTVPSSGVYRLWFTSGNIVKHSTDWEFLELTNQSQVHVWSFKCPGPMRRMLRRCIGSYTTNQV